MLAMRCGQQSSHRIFHCSINNKNLAKCTCALGYIEAVCACVCVRVCVCVWVVLKPRMWSPSTFCLFIMYFRWCVLLRIHRAWGETCLFCCYLHTCVEWARERERERPLPLVSWMFVWVLQPLWPPTCTVKSWLLLIQGVQAWTDDTKDSWLVYISKFFLHTHLTSLYKVSDASNTLNIVVLSCVLESVVKQVCFLSKIWVTCDHMDAGNLFWEGRGRLGRADLVC